MKKILFAFLFVGLGFYANAQDSVLDKFYVSVGANVWNNFRINSVFKSGTVPKINLTTFEIGIGEVLQYKKMLFNAELSAYIGAGKTTTSSYRFNGGSISISYQYNILRAGDYKLYAGLIADYLTSGLTLYAGNNKIDFNNGLDPINHNGLIQLYNSNFLMGPTLSTGDLFPNSDFSMYVAVSYEFNLIHGRWKSRFAQVEHAPKEDAGRFNFRILFPLH